MKETLYLLALLTLQCLPNYINETENEVSP